MNKLIQNAIYLSKADKYIVSSHTHDWVSFNYDGSEVKESENYDGWDGYIDGGLSYQRAGGNWIHNPEEFGIEDYCLYDDSDFSDIKNKFLWGTYGRNGNEKLKWVTLRSCTSEHLQNILKTQLLCSELVVKIVCSILEDRGEIPAMKERNLNAKVF